MAKEIRRSKPEFVIRHSSFVIPFSNPQSLIPNPYVHVRPIQRPLDRSRRHANGDAVAARADAGRRRHGRQPRAEPGDHGGRGRHGRHRRRPQAVAQRRATTGRRPGLALAGGGASRGPGRGRRDSRRRRPPLDDLGREVGNARCPLALRDQGRRHQGRLGRRDLRAEERGQLRLAAVANVEDGRPRESSRWK